MTKSKASKVDLSADIPPTSAAAVIAELERRGYDDSAALSYASAARSWTERDTPERAVWNEVEDVLRKRVR